MCVDTCTAWDTGVNIMRNVNKHQTLPSSELQKSGEACAKVLKDTCSLYYSQKRIHRVSINTWIHKHELVKLNYTTATERERMLPSS